MASFRGITGQVMDILTRSQTPLTATEMHARMSDCARSSVMSAMTRLKREGRVRAVGSRPCGITGGTAVCYERARKQRVAPNGESPAVMRDKISAIAHKNGKTCREIVRLFLSRATPTMLQSVLEKID